MRGKTFGHTPINGLQSLKLQAKSKFFVYFHLSSRHIGLVYTRGILFIFKCLFSSFVCWRKACKKFKTYICFWSDFFLPKSYFFYDFILKYVIKKMEFPTFFSKFTLFDIVFNRPSSVGLFSQTSKKRVLYQRRLTGKA